MLPLRHKLTSPTQFRRTIKAGRRAGSATVVVHVFDRRRRFRTESENDSTIKTGTDTDTDTGPVTGAVNARVAQQLDLSELSATGPRFGLVVSKAVGNAVVRHRTSRRLRHICLNVIAEHALTPTTDVVIRALPPAGFADSAQLAHDVHKALKKATSPHTSGGSARGTNAKAKGRANGKATSKAAGKVTGKARANGKHGARRGISQ